MMNTLVILATRNIKLYLRDKLSVFFSFLSSLIIILLYALFLKSNLTAASSQGVGFETYSSWFVDSWLVAGLLVINSITVSLGVLGLMITDQSKNRLRSFLIAPISRNTIVFGYVLAAWVIGSVMTILTFILGEIYIVINGGELLSALAMLQVIGLILLNVFSNTSIIFCIVALIRSEGAYQTFSTILGTVIGFITGMYLPIGLLSAPVQAFTKFIPATYGVALTRQVMMRGPINMMFKDAPQAAITRFEKFFGSQVFIGDYQCPPILMIMILLLSGLVFIALSVMIINRKK
ncbi:MAG: ABC transporter permease [Candidatus Cloacimonadaceae bacterium]|nr:ABC transporter permease [Candidatus Cloacimonadota bacterium]MCB5254977.1 ABC transporter permease [Candidatus Cloacimonadota bacterium]MCK9242769.1 ABC transporter permease [Candidatus Cloacimonadota bacterium]MDD3532626.1 ABC transporter permease [Candidatus Cloacimonadota bacterium]